MSTSFALHERGRRVLACPDRPTHISGRDHRLNLSSSVLSQVFVQDCSRPPLQPALQLAAHIVRSHRMELGQRHEVRCSCLIFQLIRICIFAIAPQ
jgi:hypothetical protein